MSRSAAADIDLPAYIDHALLDPFATDQQVLQACSEAEQYRFAAVCVYPAHVRQAVNLLKGKPPKVATVIGFPTGATTSAVKLYEAQEAVEHGADELDVVINFGWVKQGKSELLHRELAEICELCDRPVKAILELGRLTPDERNLAIDVCLDAGVAFLKTNTGWFGGATVADVRYLHEKTKGNIGIKASGGIRTAEQALELIVAGATRLGTSRGPQLIQAYHDKA